MAEVTVLETRLTGPGAKPVAGLAPRSTLMLDEILAESTVSDLAFISSSR